MLWTGTYGGVGAVAEAAGVQLGVFDSVRGQVHLQAGGVRVTTVTVVALVGLVLVVLPAVGLHTANENTQFTSQ